jgi:CDP-glucose 4,6-dehydratase
MLLAEHAARDDVRAQAFNVTPAEPISVLELVKTVLRVAGSDLEPEVLGGPTNEPVEFVEHLSGAKLRDTLGWEPRFSLEDGIRRTLDWYTEHGDEWLASSVH